MKTLAQEQCLTELVTRLRTVTPDSTRRWGRMTAHQMVCHVSDACRMAMGQQRVSDASSPLRRTLIKWMALYLPLPWRRGIFTRPEIDQQVAGTKPTEFAADVAALEGLLHAVAARSARGGWPRHPVFGTMSHAEWLRWGYLHTDHHLRQFGA
jgi:hypothetical protein